MFTIDTLRRLALPAALSCGSSLLLVCGCATSNDPINPSHPWVPPSARVGYTPGAVAATQPPVVAPEPHAPVAPVGQPDISSVPKKQIAPEPERVLGDPFANSGGTILRIGQLLRVTFTDVIPAPPPYDAQIRDDGTIGLPLNVRLTANGKTARELEDAIHEAYVPRYYKILSVNVATAELFYFVGGEVRVPSRQPFSGPISVTRAIDTAGGFTDFARKSRIELRRANGEIIRVDYDKARRSPDKDPNVYSGDQVLVPKRNPLW